MSLTKWLIFTVILGLGPLLANGLAAAGDDRAVRLGEIIGRGELFVIAAAVTADGLGRIWNVSTVNDIAGTICFGSLAFLLVATCIEFGWISNDLKTVHEISFTHMRNSLIIFSCSVVTAFAAVVLEGEG